MEVEYWPKCGRSVCKRSVATLGVFDGVHLGHQQIIERVFDEASVRDLPSVVITFDRHPTDVLNVSPDPFITSIEHRLQLFEDLGIDLSVVIEFTEKVASMEAPVFARQFFGDLLGVEKLILGFDARFGHGARGDIQLCRAMSDELDMETEQIAPFYVEGEVASSTRVRRAIQSADLGLARKLLGRPFSLLGRVVHGAGMGQKLGYPTANLDVHNELTPKCGVYATLVQCRGRIWESVTSIGTRKTFPEFDDPTPVVEVHLIGSAVDLYGEDVEVIFKSWIRSQKCFETTAQLRDQIGRDVEVSLHRLSEPQA